LTVAIVRLAGPPRSAPGIRAGAYSYSPGGGLGQERRARLLLPVWVVGRVGPHGDAHTVERTIPPATCGRPAGSA